MGLSWAPPPPPPRTLAADNDDGDDVPVPDEGAMKGEALLEEVEEVEEAEEVMMTRGMRRGMVLVL